MSIIILIFIILAIIVVLPSIVASVSRKQSKLVKGLLYIVIFAIIFMCLNKYFLKKEGFMETGKAPNVNLVFNKGGPSWGQWTLNPSLVPSTIYVQDQKESNGDQKGNAFFAGDIPVTPIVKKTVKEYNDANTYYLGDIIAYNGSWYINLAWTDARGPAYSGSHKSSPDTDKNVWKKFNISTIPNTSLNFNYGGPAWGQFTINPTLIPEIVEPSTTINTGSITLTTSPSISPYQNANTYSIGNLVSHNGRNYINLAYKDPRGVAYSGSFQQSPDTDKNVWKRVKVAM